VVLLSASVLLSRVLGFAREMLLAYRAGAGAATDAYYAAFQIPDLLNYLLAGGALSIAFVPLYTKYLARDDEEGAERLFATVLGTLGSLTLAAVAALWWFAEPLVALQFPRFDSDTLALTVRLTRIVVPAQLFFVTGGIINATLLARGRFGPSAAAPLLYNAGIIAGGLCLAPFTASPVEGFSWGALVGAVLGPFLAPLIDAWGRVRIRVRVALHDRAFLGYLLVAAPLMLGQTLLTVDEWYERWFGALLGAGSVAHLSYARKLMLVPVAVVGQAIATAALPALARLWAEGRSEELHGTLLRTLQAGIALAIVGAAGFFVLADPLVRLIYQHGAFSAADTVAVAAVLALLALAVPAWIIQQIAVRAFYARGDTWRPMLLGTGVALAAIPLYLSLGNAFGVRGLAAAGVIGMSVNAAATVLLARWLHGGPDLSHLLATAARAAAIAMIAAVAAHHLRNGFGAHGLVGASAELVSGGLAFAVFVLAGVWALGDDLMRRAFGRLLRRGREEKTASAE
jgi:putative peptidoglycan lipid II flippase